MGFDGVAGADSGQGFLGGVHNVVMGNIPAAQADGAPQDQGRADLPEQGAPQILINGGHRVAIQDYCRLNPLQSGQQILSGKGAVGADFDQAHPLALFPQQAYRQPGSGGQGTHSDNGDFGILHPVSFNQAAVAPAGQLDIILMGLFQPGFGGNIQRRIQLIAAFHILPFHINIAVAAHPLAAIVGGKI